jgi:hypothetical protein
MTTVLAYLINAAVVTLMCLAARRRGWPLGLAVAAMTLGVGLFSLMVEAVAFGVLGVGEAARVQLTTGAVFAAFSIAAGIFGSKLPGGAADAPAALRIGPGRVAAGGLLYCLLYFVAGMIVYPFVQDFYATRRIPPLGEILTIQLFRSLIFIVAAALFLRTAPRWAGLVLGAGFAVIGGLAPLMEENPYMPAHVRAAHAVEVGVSNFLYGVLLTLILTARRAAAPGRRAPAGA